jgi:hypothetical protein
MIRLHLTVPRAAKAWAEGAVSPAKDSDSVAGAVNITTAGTCPTSV